MKPDVSTFIALRLASLSVLAIVLACSAPAALAMQAGPGEGPHGGGEELPNGVNKEKKPNDPTSGPHGRIPTPDKALAIQKNDLVEAKRRVKDAWQAHDQADSELKPLRDIQKQLLEARLKASKDGNSALAKQLDDQLKIRDREYEQKRRDLGEEVLRNRYEASLKEVERAREAVNKSSGGNTPHPGAPKFNQQARVETPASTSASATAQPAAAHASSPQVVYDKFLPLSSTSTSSTAPVQQNYMNLRQNPSTNRYDSASSPFKK